MPLDALFQPYQLGPLTLTNRIVMAPLTRSRSNDEGVPPAYAADYYAQRAEAGLIISEATNISPRARGYAKTPGIWSEAQVEAWKPVTERVHSTGGVFFLQFWHTGRLSHPSLQPGGALPISASAIKPEGQAFTNEGMVDYVAPRALEASELPAILDEYALAASNARRAGFDGVEIHSANNYFLDQWLRDSTNQRTDEYGGSVENRLRFPLAVVQAVIDGFGDARRVGIRLSPGTTMPGGAPLDSNPNEVYGRYVEALDRLGLTYLHMIEGITQQTREAPAVNYAALHGKWSRTYIGNNMYSMELMEKELREGKSDLFALGRAFLANPDLVERLRVGAPLADAPKEYWYGGNERGYTDWPTLAGQLQTA